MEVGRGRERACDCSGTLRLRRLAMTPKLRYVPLLLCSRSPGGVLGGEESSEGLA
jgi:hypothetical protein